jgi:glutathione synthase/RimK-type ligase-like ATP-grasp enzyme
VHTCPASGSDPLGYLETVNQLLASGDYDVLLPTHEQTWLFAAAGQKLYPNAPIAVAPAKAFSSVQSKLEFARLLDELKLPQPKWALVESPDELLDWQTPFYLNAPFSTAGSGVRRVTGMSDAAATFQALELASNGEPLMVQAAVEGQYAQV